jgi:hypothetical protein
MPPGFYKTIDDEIVKDTQLAINIADGKGVMSPTLAQAWSPDKANPPYPPHPNLSDIAGSIPACALLMDGTTKELKAMLKDASVKGTEAFWSSDDCLLVWLIRRKVRNETKSLVLIAPKKKFLKVDLDDPVKIHGHDRGWRFLARSKTDGEAGYQGLGLNWLRHEILDEADKRAAWVVVK